jgi:membrane protein
LSALDAVQQSRRASGAIGAIVLFLGASWVFGELVSAFNIIWQLQAPARGGPLEFLRATLFSFALMLSAAFLLLVSMVVNAVLTTIGALLANLPGGSLAWGIASLTLNLVVLALLFALLLKYLPQTWVAWGDVWLGAVLTAVLWTLLQNVIALYITWSSYKNYGAIGAVLALVVWVYLSSQVLFLGGEFTAVYAQRYGSRSSFDDGR